MIVTDEFKRRVFDGDGGEIGLQWTKISTEVDKNREMVSFKKEKKKKYERLLSTVIRFGTSLKFIH